MKAKIAVIDTLPPAKAPAGFGGLGIPSVLAAIATNLRISSPRQPGTLLRLLSLIAITAVMRSRGFVLVPERRQAVIDAMELGALLNDRFDGDPYEPASLRERVNAFARSMHRDVIRSYASRLRQLEKSRPDRTDDDCGVAVQLYRENVNRTSLAVLWALAHTRSLRVAEMEIEREPDLRLLFKIVMLAQLIDDVLDAHEDRRQGLPSFVTGGAPLPEILRIYADAEPLRLDRNFCLRIALRIMTMITRLTLYYYSTRFAPISC